MLFKNIQNIEYYGQEILSILLLYSEKYDYF